MLKGNLSSFSLGEIFQSLAINNHTGTLRIQSRDGTLKCVYFSKGEISLLSNGSPHPLRIGEILIRMGRLSAEALVQALEEQKTTNELLGELLERKRLITKEDIRAALETKIREEIYDLFLLQEAEFEFHINHLPEELFDALQRSTRIAINTNSVVMEGLRRVDEWTLIQRRIKTFNEIFVPTSHAQEAEGPQDDPDLKAVLGLLDGTRTVRDLFAYFPGTRFDCAKLLYELVEAGCVRLVTAKEACVSGRVHVAQKTYPAAEALFRFACETDPECAEGRQELAAYLDKLGRGAEAVQPLQQLVQIHARRGDHENVLGPGRTLLETAGDLPEEIAESIYASALAKGDRALARSAANRILNAAQDAGNLHRRIEILEQLCPLDPEDLNLRIELAEHCTRAGEKARGVQHLEAVAAVLRPKKKKRYKELLKVLLLCFEIDSTRLDIKGEIQELLALQERQEMRRKQRVTLVGGGVIAALALAVVPIVYEVKARENFVHAQRLEEIALVSKDYSKVKAAYESVLKTYTFSTVASRSKFGLERVAELERRKLDSLQGERKGQEAEQQRKLDAMRRQFPLLLEEARRAGASGDPNKEFEICTRLITEFAEMPGAQGLQFPLQITSSPRGAQVEVNGEAVGSTPTVLRFPRDTELTVLLTRSGCEPAQQRLRSGERWQIHTVLKRKPIEQMKLSGPIHQPLVLGTKRIFFPSRDGSVYAVNTDKSEVLWQRRVGRFGDLGSDLIQNQEDLLAGTVGGEVVCVAKETGKLKWRTQAGGAILAAPSVSSNGRWVASATIDGGVVVLDSQNGTVLGRFQAEDEVLCSPVFGEGILIVAAADQRIYELSVPDAKPRAALDLPSAPCTPLLRQGDSVCFGTRSGGVHRYRIVDRSLVWSRSVAQLSGCALEWNEQILFGTTTGMVVGLGTKDGAQAWSTKLSTGTIRGFAGDVSRVYAAAESGEVVALDPTTGSVEWRYQAETALLAPPLVIDQRLYVPCMNGRILVLELME